MATSTPGTMQLCVRGFAGMSTFSVGYTPDGSSDVYALPLGANVAVLAGTCATVFTATLTEPLNYDPPATVHLVQLTNPVGSVFDHTLTTQYTVQAPCNPEAEPCGDDVKGTSTSTDVKMNAYHGSVVTYFNAALGCAYSHGYWKGHTESWPAGSDPTDPFFSSGTTWLGIMQAPPKGDPYVILAQQYVAAALNVANGAYMPPLVKTAFDAATAYFGGGAGGNLTGWASTLDGYNTGLALSGPPHCE
ncbi:MAG TPA: hypothetical protein VFS59_11550 [Gemmatimonadaceae bacterium]|nr:hypothetical protein [Gemmatimonadaceae bacterium]